MPEVQIAAEVPNVSPVSTSVRRSAGGTAELRRLFSLGVWGFGAVAAGEKQADHPSFWGRLGLAVSNAPDHAGNSPNPKAKPKGFNSTILTSWVLVCNVRNLMKPSEPLTSPASKL